MNDNSDPVPPDADGPPPTPRELRFLKILVTTLTATMIGGLITIIVLIVIRVPSAVRRVELPAPLPDSITLPEGATARAFTQGPDWYAVVTTDDRILIYDRAGGHLLKTITLREAR